MRQAALTVLFALAAGAAAAGADAWGVAYSGHLTLREDGRSVDWTGVETVDLTVSLYDESDGSETNCLKSIAFPATRVLDGCFTLELAGLGDVLADRAGSKLTIGVRLGAGDELAPRQSFASVPAAAWAADALGADRALTVTGSVTASALTVTSAVTFRGPVTHEGTAVFTGSKAVPVKSLSPGGKPLAAQSLTVRDASSAGNLTAGRIEAREAALAVTSADSLAAKRIDAPNAAVAIGALNGTDLTVNGSVTAKKVKARDLRVGPRQGFFKWAAHVNRLAPTAEASTVYGYQTGDGGASGTWVAQENCLVSVSPVFVTKLTVAVTSKDGTSVTFEQKESSNEKVVMPLQLFLRKGEKVSWQGAVSNEDSAEGPYLCYRGFAY